MAKKRASHVPKRSRIGSNGGVDEQIFSRIQNSLRTRMRDRRRVCCLITRKESPSC